MNKPHKHAEVIKAWADGKEVQCRITAAHAWSDYPGEHLANWCRIGASAYEWRIKPKNVVRYASVDDSPDAFYTHTYPGYETNLKLTFENGKLVKAEVL